MTSAGREAENDPPPRRGRGEMRLELLLVGVLALGAVFHRPLAELRPPAPDARPRSATVVVTSGADAGAGSLREAIFAAAEGQAARIEVRAPRIGLATPLPPLLAAGTLALEAAGGAEIDASRLDAGPAIEVATPGAVARGLRVRGAAGTGWLVNAPNVELRDVGAAGCGIGLDAAGGGLRLAASAFSDNALGVRLPPRPGGATVFDNRFADHRQAALWAVAPEPAGDGHAGRGDAELELRGNRFERDAIALVVANVAAAVEDNDFLAAREAAVYLIGHGGTVAGNRIRGARALGVFADAPRGATIARNELAENRAVAILVRSGGNTCLEENVLVGNGYGIATVFGSAEDVGSGEDSGDGSDGVLVARNRLSDQLFDGLYVVAGAPRLERNRVVGSGGAGLRILDYLPLSGERLEARPVLAGNVLERNGVDGAARGIYRERRPRGDDG